ncbi:MAG: serine hydrolase domain-containing protein [Pseudomonadota bacterium]
MSSVAASQSATITPEKITAIDAFVDDRLTALGMPGAAIALIQDGDIIHAKGFGTVSLGGGTVTADTPFELGSISKSFAATAILLLSEAGKLNLDDPVIEHLHWFRTHQAFRSDQITLRHLLTHRSGLTTYDGNRTHARLDMGPAAMSDAVRTFSRFRLRTDPGDQYQYSNANYLLLGAVVEAVSGQPYEIFIGERILQPLGLANSWAGPAPQGRSDLARPHRYWFGSVAEHQTRPSRVHSAYGGMRASARDLATYLLSFTNDSNALLSPESRADMMTISEPGSEPGYGLGWFVADTGTHKLVYHTGANPGFSTIAGISTDGRFGFVALVNGQSSFTDQNVSSLPAGVADLALDRPIPTVSMPLQIRALRGAVLILPAALVLWLVVIVIRRQRRGFRTLSDLTPLGIFGRVVVPSIAMLLLAYGLYVYLPRLNTVPMSAVNLFSPDIGFMLTLSALLALVIAIVRPILRLKPRP